MCRSIKTLREPFTVDVTNEDVHAAALQYVRKISGFRKPAAHNAEAFDEAVAGRGRRDGAPARPPRGPRRPRAHALTPAHSADRMVAGVAI